MFHKLTKGFFKILINSLQTIRVALVFLAFATALYWFLDLAGVKFFDFITAFFGSIQTFMHGFYTRTVDIDTATVDFSFLLATFIMMGISWGLKYVVETIEFAEKKYDSFHSAFKRKSEEIFNKGLEHQRSYEESKNDNFLVLVQICASNMAKDSHFNKDVDAGVEEKQKDVLYEFSKILSSKTKCQKKNFEDKLLLYFESFNEDVDGAFFEIKKAVGELSDKYKQDRWKIDALVAVEPYSKQKEIDAKVISLKKLLRLGLKGEIACLSTFNQRYALLKHPKYKLEGKGIYTINDKEETVFCVERIIST